MAGQNTTVIVDPLEEIQSLLQSFGLYNAISKKFLASDYPAGTDDEYLRQYLYGAGRPFINFLVFVDVGVGYDIEINSDNESLNTEIKQMVEEFTKTIGYQTTLIQFATYLEVLGRSCIVTTKNISGDDFYFNEYENITGIDVINPITLDRQSIKDSFRDPKGKTPFIQKYWDNDGRQIDVEISRDRIIYSTKNPFTRNAVDGVSAFANCMNELRLAARVPRYESQIYEKVSKLHRHFQVDTEKFKELKQGKEILNSKKKSERYLLSIHKMINSMNEKGSDVATMDYIISNEVSYAGKIPDIANMKKSIFESIAMKMEIPLNTMTYGADVNRATLEVLSDIFVRRRETGSQLEYIRISEKLINDYIFMKGYEDVTCSFVFKPFLPDDINEMYDKVSNFAARMQGILSATEIRRLIGKPDKIEYGEADEQLENELNKLMAKKPEATTPKPAMDSVSSVPPLPEPIMNPDGSVNAKNLEDMEFALRNIIQNIKNDYNGVNQ